MSDHRADKKELPGRFAGYLEIESRDEKALMEALYTLGPIAVAVDAGAFCLRACGHCSGCCRFSTGRVTGYRCWAHAMQHALGLTRAPVLPRPHTCIKLLHCDCVLSQWTQHGHVALS